MKKMGEASLTIYEDKNLPLCHKIRINRIDRCRSVDVIGSIVVSAVIAVNFHGVSS